MCRKHLVSEHGECHAFVKMIENGRKVEGYIKGGTLDPSKLIKRHNRLVKEMLERGYNHATPLSTTATLVKGNIPKKTVRKLLISRCPECKQGYKLWKKNRKK